MTVTRSKPGVGKAARLALVTGGGRGIGRGIALQLADDGFDTVICYRSDRAAAERVAAEIKSRGRRSAAIAADLSDPAAGEQLVRKADRLGGIHVLVSNAGRLATTSLLKTTPADYDVQQEANARGSFFVVQAAAHRMIAQGEGGRVIIVTSDAASRPYRGLSAYCMSKAALKMLTEVAAVELAPYGITVNAVAPGTTETDMNRATLADPGTRDLLLGSILLGRAGRPEDVATAVSFLASDRASFVTGATVAVDGGAAIH